ncbi:shikimate dehydrogenase [Microbacterium sp. SGAir0570]|jgi:shikimate dehydrogenase|uniref:shikimate dehydrogenase family protein n=1 Tax=Microbacterium TaxID=33882 RepID=UPI000903E9F8|nr:MULTISPECIES: shikimate dehydrogenase [Microbacterium]APF33519.1 shikimate dehydrogenase [Microbacterium paludicola]QCR40166.1 shikimate dehydrogenase [Microbacterium sp. SGAir0570]
MTTAAAEPSAGEPRRFEVWGSPIGHSLSPALHTAAYDRLGLPWRYGRRRVDESSFARELAALGPEWRGLSLTMPLKTLAHDAARTRDAAATATGAANTLVRSGDGWAAFNTDVGGLAAALTEIGSAAAPRARIVGAGATATSALLALERIGVGRIDIAARRPAAADPLLALAASRGIPTTVSPLDAPAGEVELTVSTLPGDAPVSDPDAERLAATGGTLYDVVYGTWPTALGHAWLAAGQPAHPGATMLLHQAVLQIRIFASGSPDDPLTGEEDVVAVMRRSLMGG